MNSFLISTGNIIIRQTAIFICMAIWIWKKNLNWLDEKYLSDFDEIEVDSEIKYQKPFSQMQEIVQEYSIASDESEADNTYLSTIK